MKLSRQFAVVAQAQIRMGSQRAGIYFTQFGITVIVSIPMVAITSLPEYHGTGTVVIADDGGIEVRVVIQLAETGKAQRFIECERIVRRFLGNDIHHSGNSRRTVRGRSSTMYYLHTFDHYWQGSAPDRKHRQGHS